MGKLTEAKVRTSKPENKDRWLNDGSGLYLRIRKGGGKVWVIRRKQHGKTQIITLNDYPTLSLREARLKAAEYQLKKSVSNTSVAFTPMQSYSNDRPIHAILYNQATNGKQSII